MTEQTTPGADEKCVACEIGWNILLVLGVAAIAFIAADVFTQGKATEWIAGRLGQTRLASVILMRGGEQDGADAG